MDKISALKLTNKLLQAKIKSFEKNNFIFDVNGDTKTTKKTNIIKE